MTQLCSTKSFILKSMRYLIDTNIFIYLATDLESVDKDVLMILNDPENQLFLSTVSAEDFQ